MDLRKDTQHGFTLFEVLAVIVILSIAFSLVGYSVTQGLSNAQERQAGKDLLLALRQVRNQSVVSGQPVVLTFDLQRSCYQIPTKSPVCLPLGMGVRLTTAAGLSPNEPAIAFYPNGSSSGGNILLTKGERTWRIDIGWLTGNASLIESRR